MKIVILFGSPNRSGSTGILADEFTRGAEEKGHEVERFDVCHMNVHPCLGCVKCGYEGPCVQKDDVELIRQKLLRADMVVFATPLYYYGMSAQLKSAFPAVTDEQCRTSVPGVWAAGDVNGKIMLAHTAYREGEVAVSDMLGVKDRVDYRSIPSVIYTNPEVGSVGETVESAKKAGIDALEATLSLRYSGRYVAENEGGDGIVKIVYGKEHHEILGVHMIGSYASEIIYGAAAMVAKKQRVADVEKLVFPHPTVCEVIREAMFSIQ